MDQKKRIIISAVGAIILIVGAVLVATRPQAENGNVPDSSGSETSTARVLTKEELAAGDGLGENPCYVAVDGTVYQISDSVLWVMGVHTPTKGLIKCGQDHSQTILNSPHGKSKLKYLDIVGTLAL